MGLIFRLLAPDIGEGCLADVNGFIGTEGFDYGNYKGQHGRLGIIGGSVEYTGAPYYAATAALRAGADLATVFCAEEAATAIKCYSPELMVRSLYSYNEDQATESDTSSRAEEILKENLPRLKSIVAGPGLGRSRSALGLVKRLLSGTLPEMPIVMDADALMVLEGAVFELIKGRKQIFLTCNFVEFKRLVRRALEYRMNADLDQIESAEYDIVRIGAHDENKKYLQELAQWLETVVIIVKGETDWIACGDVVTSIDAGLETHSRRVGGQGDVLAGILGVTSYWAMQRAQSDGWLGALAEQRRVMGVEERASATPDLPVASAALACLVTRRASKQAFMKHGRAMSTTDILDRVGEALDYYTSSGHERAY